MLAPITRYQLAMFKGSSSLEHEGQGLTGYPAGGYNPGKGATGAAGAVPLDVTWYVTCDI